MKLQMIRAKAALSTTKDLEKLGGQEQQQQPLLNSNDSPINIAAEAGPKNGITFTAYRCPSVASHKAVNACGQSSPVLHEGHGLHPGLSESPCCLALQFEMLCYF
jgi:hypothetical protein